MSKNYELELYKLIKENGYVSELGWVDDNSFCIWIEYRDIEEFMRKVFDIFGREIFDDGSFVANMQSDGICIELCDVLDGYIVVEDIFPKEEYQY